MAIRNPNADEIIKEYDELQTAEINRVGDEMIKPNTAFFARGVATDANLGHNTTGNSGWYVTGGGSINVPNDYGVLIHFDRDPVSKAQIFVQVSNGVMYSRARSSSGVWSAWRTVT